MDDVFISLIERCKAALDTPDPQGSVEAVVRSAVKDPAIVQAVAARYGLASLDAMAIHRDKDLTVLAASIPPGFYAGPHTHNLWSVVGVCAGQEDNQFFERDGTGLKQVAEASVVGPNVLPNAFDVIHAIRNPLDTPLLALHAYGGDLFATPRSSWDPETHEEIAFDWNKTSQN